MALSRRCLAFALALAMAFLGFAGDAASDDLQPSHPADVPSTCWAKPEPQTVEEMATGFKNDEERARRQRAINAAATPAVLALSDGDLRTAYSAGLIVGWGETGRRPEFETVTAVGPSALLAPFAFIGADGDQAIADIMNCPAGDWKDMVELAVTYLDAAVLEKIARKSETGGQLLVVVPGSAARPEVLWDLGRLIARREPKPKNAIRDILRAAVDLVTPVDPQTYPPGVGTILKRNWDFRKTGTGEAFFLPEGKSVRPASYSVILNGVLLKFESTEYAASRAADGAVVASHPDPTLITALDIEDFARKHGAAFSFASVSPNLEFIYETPFDRHYMEMLFRHAYRQGRLGKEWRLDVPK